MKTLLSIVALVVVFAFSSQPLASSPPEQISSSEIIGNIDYPAPNAALTRAQFWIGGWAFNTVRGGQQPHSIRLILLAQDRGPVLVPVTRLGPLNRPDVKAYFMALGFSEVSSFTGWHLVPEYPDYLPLGTFVVSVELADSFGAVYRNRTVTIVE